MLSIIFLMLAKAWLSSLARGPCSMEQRAVMISAFSTPNQGNLRREGRKDRNQDSKGVEQL